METKEIVLLFIVLPAILFTLAFLYLKSKKFSKIPNGNYSISFFSKRIVLSKHEIIILIVLFLFFSWLNMFSPLALSLLIVFGVLFTFPIASFKRYDSKTNQENTQILLNKLTTIENEIESARQHFGILQGDLNQAQLEVDKKQKIKEELDAIILENKTNAETWASMSEAQKNLVSQTTVNAISQKIQGNYWQGMLWGFLINLLATLTWTLMGNPGKDDIISKFNTLIEMIKGQ
ncbi:MAG: hypothetical protein JNK00_13035 [Flavipsychrobacter sp.]|nr:hypothetical protein [Flavipsychrobacter sp.]